MSNHCKNANHANLRFSISILSKLSLHMSISLIKDSVNEFHIGISHSAITYGITYFETSSLGLCLSLQKPVRFGKCFDFTVM